MSAEERTSFNPENVQTAKDFLIYLWDSVGLDMGRDLIINPDIQNQQVVQARMVEKYVPRWKELTITLFTNPNKLTFRNLGIQKDVRFIQVLPENFGEPPANFDLKYSIMGGIVDLYPESTPIPLQKEAAKPQLEFTITELYSDSRRELDSAVSAMEEKLGELGTRRLRESTLYGKKFIEALLKSANAQVVTDVTLIGKAVYYDEEHYRPLNLMGIQIEITENGMALNVHQLIRFLSANYSRQIPARLPENFGQISEELDKYIRALERVIRKNV